MTINTEKLYSEILETLLGATLESAMWGTVLEKLSLISGHHYAALLFYDPHNAQMMTDSSLCEASVFRTYHDHFLDIDPAIPRLTHYPVGKIYQDKDVLGDSFIAHSVYYNEFQRPHGMNYLTCVKLNSVGASASFLSLMTAHDGVYPQQYHFELFKRVLPALITASKLYSLFDELRNQLKYQNALLDKNIYPVWLVNHAGKILYANHHAESYQGRCHDLWASKRDTICIDTESKKLKQAIERATLTDALPRAGLCYTTGSRIKPVLVIPAAHLPGTASIIIPEPQLHGNTLMELFALTPSENTLVGLLIKGMTPEACAQHLAVSITTVRSHLRALFRKTHTGNQSELLLIVRAAYG